MSNLVSYKHDFLLNVSFDVRLTKPLLSGSSVATTLTASEAKPKGVALLQIKRLTFNWTPFPLTTVRPFIFQNLDISEHFEDPNDPGDRDCCFVHCYLVPSHRCAGDLFNADLAEAVEEFIRDTIGDILAGFEDKVCVCS